MINPVKTPLPSFSCAKAADAEDVPPIIKQAAHDGITILILNMAPHTSLDGTKNLKRTDEGGKYINESD